MAKHDSISPVATAELRVILSEISDLASHGDRICFYMGCDGGADLLVHEIKFLRDLVSKLGYLAYLGLRKTAVAPQTGGAEKWLLPPIYHSCEEKLTQPELAAA